MNYAITLIALVAALGWAAVPAHEPDPTPAAEKLRAARDSRAWALQQFQRNECRPGETAVWVADKEADCLREVLP